MNIYIYIYIYKHICIHIYMYIHIFIHIHIFIILTPMYALSIWINIHDNRYRENTENEGH